MNLSELFGYTDIEALISAALSKILPFALKIIGAIIIFVIGRMFIRLLDKVLKRIFEKRGLDKSVAGFLLSLISTILLILLILTIVGSFGVSVTSFAALLASAGVALGMALSGNLQNLAGGIMMLIFKPYKVGDYIEAQGNEGVVTQIQIFHTIIQTNDNRLIYIPNGAISNGVIRNISHQPTRRISWTFGVAYGTDYNNVKNILLTDILATDKRILSDPTPSVNLDQMADSSINIVVRAWVNTPDYWNVFYDINAKTYDTFNKKGIDIPFPQVTIHQAKN